MTANDNCNAVNC